jgi:hypothetical protein
MHTKNVNHYIPAPRCAADKNDRKKQILVGIGGCSYLKGLLTRVSLFYMVNIYPGRNFLYRSRNLSGSRQVYNNIIAQEKVKEGDVKDDDS